MANDHIISSIHNYCDRWCERCVFIDRCTLGVIELKRWAKGKDWQPEDFLRELDILFDEAVKETPDWLAEMEFSMEDLAEETVPNPQLEALQNDMRKRGMRYFREVQAFLESQQTRLEERRIDLANAHIEGRDHQERSELAEALEVITWYLHFMFIKASRALSGLEDMHEEHWGNARQSDANGSAKIAMLAAQRSISAWEMVRQQWPDQRSNIVGFARQINQFRQVMERYFPDWRKFVRPGFDTEPNPVRKFGMN